MDTSGASATQQPRLLDLMRDKIRYKHYSIRTEAAYVDWARRYILFLGSGIRPAWEPKRSRRF